MSLTVWIAAGLLGGLASIARFVVGRVVTGLNESEFPIGTLAVNLSGALLLGIVAGAGVSGTALRLIATATLGAYTTFSTWMYESQRLGESGRRDLLVLNVAGSLVLGVLAVELGRAVGGAF